MGNSTVNITIAGRSYPVTVETGSEVKVLEAATIIARMLGQLEKSYTVRDKQDLLAMCAIQLAGELEEERRKIATRESMTMQRLTGIESRLDQVLS